MKIDVEGNELQVLKGAKKTIEEHQHPPIFFEVWNNGWYAKTKAELFAFIIDVLKYKEIKGVTPNMFLAVT